MCYIPDLLMLLPCFAVRVRKLEWVQPPLIQWLRRIVWRGFPYFNALFEGTLFVYQLRYLFGTHPYFSPFLQLLGQQLRRLTMEDLVKYLQICGHAHTLVYMLNAQHKLLYATPL